MSWERRRALRFRPNARVVVAGAGLVAVGTGIGIIAQIGAFYYHSSTAGRNLVGQERTEIAKAARSPAACRAPLSAAVGGIQGWSAGGQGPHGLLEVPSLGMVAPVLQGTGDSVLSDAVGHDPASAWPGQAGTSVFSAHDVTWFSRIGRLKPGNEIRYVTPCRTYTYKVTSHAIVTAGSPVYSTGTARLVLDTCYPLDALYITSTRYLVYANLTEAAPTHAVTAPEPWSTPAVPAPARLVAQGLDLAHNPAPLGTLRLTGSPSRAWTQSSATLQFQAAALAEYFAIIRSAAQEKRSWWADLAPSVSTSAAGPLWGGKLESYVSHLMITLRAAGSEPVSAAMTATVAVTGPDGAASYRLKVSETVSAGKLLVTRVWLTPV